LTYGMIICRKFIYLVYCVVMMQLLTPSKIAIFHIYLQVRADK
jgi:hypothetical protein